MEKIVGIAEDVFSRELYMNKEQLNCMTNAVMHIGSHGFDHFWLNSLSADQQRFEIEKSVEFIKNIYGNNFKNWTICYLYGEYNCSLGFTTEVKIAGAIVGENLTLPRLDTNDFPKDRNAKLNNWYDLA